MTKKDGAIQYLIKRGYLINNQGEVKNPKGDVVNLTLNKRGYKQMGVRYNGETMKITIHRLQGFVKFGEKIFNKKLQIRHLDSDKLNNSWDNIGIGTPKDNHSDKSDETIKKVSLLGTRKFQDSRRPLEVREEIYKNIINGVSNKIIMETYNVSKSTLFGMKRSQEFEEFKKNNE